MSGAEAIKYPLDIPYIKSEDVKREDPKSKWAFLTCYWYEKQKIENEDKTIVYLDENPKAHSDTVLINCKTKKIYNTDDEFFLRAKFTAIIVGTPLATIVKTIYHLFFPLSLTYQIYDTVKELKQQQKRAEKHGEKPPQNLASRVIRVIIRNLIDIVKTPIYGVIMAITSIATLILSAINKEFLYEGRVIFGEMLMSLNWGEKTTLWTLAPCMQPLADLSDKGINEKKRYYEKKNTSYEGQPKGSAVHGLNNLFRPSNKDPSCIRRMPCHESQKKAKAAG